MTQAMSTLAPAYNPQEVEEKWTKIWFDRHVFDMDLSLERPKFSISLPPPNVTGSLHMGHALNGTLQDVLVRWKRMQGYNVLWQPGTDHAGISTQMVVERQLRKEGLSREKLGRKAFLDRVWKWREEYGTRILNQYRRLGVSFCWNRLAFTMDPPYAAAVNKAFVALFKQGLVYRGTRVTNWCSTCATSISDLEVDHKETKGQLYFINYPISGGGGQITVATARPETMFGDVALGVNPRDKRYAKLIGARVKLPLTERELPVIADDYIDVEFGTGVLKITPGHDMADWEVGQRHQLPMPVVVDLKGKLCANDYVPSRFQGKKTASARSEVVEELQASGYLAEVREYTHGVAHCDRCGTVIEPLPTEQWYVSMAELAEPAIRVVEEQRITFVPERYAATYLDWMRHIKDWCVSRQLWWGHRIPVWSCNKCGLVGAFDSGPSACTKCGASGSDWVQDPDVLDTWFSSALWPFVTLGWPEKTEEMRLFYPTTVLSTARDIINLWVARMIFMSLRLCNTIPFKQVLVHPVIQTADGKRMSKSKGNVIDPLEMIEKYGVDANRFWFISLGVKNDQDVRFREDRLEEYRRFANKIWNAGRFVLAELKGRQAETVERNELTLPDRWIMHRFNDLLNTVHEGLRNYDLDDACRAIYGFVWNDFCDWYLEIAKIQLSGGYGRQTAFVLHSIFEQLMRLLHPIMPFITEELWGALPRSPALSGLKSIMFAPFPRDDVRFYDEAADTEMELIMRVVRAVRNIRQTFNVPANASIPALVACPNADKLACLRSGSQYIASLAKVSELTIDKKMKVPSKTASEMISNVAVYVPLSGVIDVEKARTKLLSRKHALERELGKMAEILGSSDFKSKAPKAKVDSLLEQHQGLKSQMESLQSQLQVLEST